MLTLAFIVLSFLSYPLAGPVPQDRLTLYSLNKHPGQQLRSCVSFREPSDTSSRSCDVRYGALYVGDDLDWFASSAAGANRSLIKDLGAKNWDDDFTVPVVEPLPKLKPGEQRVITIDASGADGAPGRNGASARAQPGPFEVGTEPNLRSITTVGTDRPKKREPRVDPIFVKAIKGHLYVIHVVDDVSDYYALFRVESIERGVHCTISWRLIPSPETNLRTKQN